MPVGNQIGSKKSFWGLISKTKIEIPQIQRDYVQGRNTEQIKISREKFISDIYNAINTDSALDLNFVYGKIQPGGEFIPVDGQQRLTTLFLLHVFAFSKNGKTAELKTLNDNFTYKTRITTQRFFEALIENISDYFLANTYNKISEYIFDMSWFSPLWINDPTVNSSIIVLEEIERKFDSLTDLDSKLRDADCPVTFMELSIASLGNENELYIKLNSRGKPLTPFENFKANLYEYIKTLSTLPFTAKEFIKNMDSSWLEFVWDLCKDHKKESDRTMMNLLHWLIIDRSIVLGKNIETIYKSFDFYNFESYKPFLQVEVIQQIYCSFEFFVEIKAKNKKLYDELKSILTEIAVSRAKDSTYYIKRVLLYSISKYANVVSTPLWDMGKTSDFYRVVYNLVNNTWIDDPQKFVSALNSIDTLGSICIDPIIEMSKMTQKNIFFFDASQSEEEILKCKLMSADRAWKSEIEKAEQNKYFKGKINFMFELQGISAAKMSTIPSHATEIAVFASNWFIICKLFCDSGLKIEDSLFRRALLTFGDYSIEAGSGSKTFYFEGGREYFNWRRMVRDSFGTFTKLFNEIRNKPTISVNEVLEDCINSFTDKTNILWYHLIKLPKIFEYMGCKKYYNDFPTKFKNRTILYSKQMLSAEYAEANTFAIKELLAQQGIAVDYQYGRGYLEYNDSRAFITKIDGKDCLIEWKDNKFCDKVGALKDAAGIDIVTIEGIIRYLESKGYITNSQQSLINAV